MKINTENMKRYHSDPLYLIERRIKRKQKVLAIQERRNANKL